MKFFLAALWDRIKVSFEDLFTTLGILFIPTLLTSPFTSNISIATLIWPGIPLLAALVLGVILMAIDFYNEIKRDAAIRERKSREKK